MINDTASFCIHGGLVKFGCNLCSQDKEIFERLDKLEKLDDFNDEIHSAILNSIKNIEKEIDERINELSEKLNNLISMPNIAWAKYNKTPHKCPVCDGSRNSRGRYFDEFLRAGMETFIECKSCDGKGILWG